MLDTETFQPTLIDLSMRDIVTIDGQLVTLCHIESNVEFSFAGEVCRSMRGTYSLGRVIEPRQPLQLDVGVFSLILVNCGDHMGVFAISHVVPEDPTFMIKVIVDDEILAVKPSDISRDEKAAFDFAWFDKTHRLRIETIPNIDMFYEQSLAAHRHLQKGDADANG